MIEYMKNECGRIEKHCNAWLVRLGKEARLNGYILKDENGGRMDEEKT